MRDDDRMNQGGGPPDLLEAEAFQPFVGSTMHADGYPITLTLARVDVEDRSPASAPRKPFSLLFHGPKALDPLGRDLLPEGLHRCSFGDGAVTHDIYVAPIHTPDGERQDYEAAFN